MLTWTGTPGVEYWVFSATDASLSTSNWLSLPNGHAYLSAVSPFYLCGLYDGKTYYFAANGRTNGGPGGPGTPVVSATPYNASTSTWSALTTPVSQPDLFGTGYTSLTTCANTSSSATGEFAAVGAGGAIFTSPDASNWNSVTSPLTTDLYAVTGYAATQNNVASPGLRWVAVGAGGASVYSTDGVIWTIGNDFNTSSTANPNNYALRSITQISGTFFAAGDGGTILSSTDGITWTSHVSGTPNNLKGIAHGTNYVAVGDGGTILTSSDGNTWTTQTSGTTSNLRKVAYYTSIYGSIIVAVGDGGTVVTSKDNGTTWYSQTLGTNNLAGVAAEPLAYDATDTTLTPDAWLTYIPNGQFVITDDAGNSYHSVTGTDPNANGLTWDPASIATGNTNVNDLLSTGYGYLVVGNAGTTAYSF